MKFYIRISICITFITLISFRNIDHFFKYNTCDFNKYKIKVDNLHAVSIIRYSILNFTIKDNSRFSEYYLINTKSDTFNIINTYSISTSDSTVEKFRNSTNWIFLPMKDTCFEFYSQFNLKKIIDYKYPVLFGQIVQGLD